MDNTLSTTFFDNETIAILGEHAKRYVQSNHMKEIIKLQSNVEREHNKVKAYAATINVRKQVILCLLVCQWIDLFYDQTRGRDNLYLPRLETPKTRQKTVAELIPILYLLFPGMKKVQIYSRHKIVLKIVSQYLSS